MKEPEDIPQKISKTEKDEEEEKQQKWEQDRNEVEQFNERLKKKDEERTKKKTNDEKETKVFLFSILPSIYCKINSYFYSLIFHIFIT